MPLHVGVGSVEGGPFRRTELGVHAIVTQLARRHGGECVVVVHGLNGSVDVPVAGHTIGGIQDSALLGDGKDGPSPER